MTKKIICISLLCAFLCSCSEHVSHRRQVSGQKAGVSHPGVSHPLAAYGRIVAHEIGYFNFPPQKHCTGFSPLPVSNTCPGQVRALAKYNQSVARDPSKTIRFIKISGRTLADGEWVIAHDDSQHIGGHSIKLSAITKEEYLQYRKKYPEFRVFLLEEYLAEDPRGNFAWMINTKTPPNQKLLADIKRLALQQRSMIEVEETKHAEWIFENSQQDVFYFSTRVNTIEDWQQVQSLVSKYGKKFQDSMYFVEVVARQPQSADLVKRIQAEKMNFAELDSMPYAPLKEFFKTGCSIPLDRYGAAITMSSRPVDCVKNHPNFPPHL